ncbi:MAG: hypothetical protein ACLP8X_39720 [Streptosporangiaceae bacterium]
MARRRQLRRPPWRAARFLARRQLRALGGRHGRVRLHGALFTPGRSRAAGMPACSLEALWRRVCPATGAFQVLAVEKAA